MGIRKQPQQGPPQPLIDDEQGEELILALAGAYRRKLLAKGDYSIAQMLEEVGMQLKAKLGDDFSRYLDRDHQTDLE